MDNNLKKKNSNVRKLILGSFLGILIGSLISVTYAMFTFNSTSINNKLIAGDIYMRYKETTGLDISGAMPSTTYDNTKYFEFDIIGKNTSNRDVWYEIVLADGDKPNNRNTKLDDKFLKFTLYKGNELVVNGVSYDDITNQRLYTGTIEKNTNTDTTTTYKLYMWIDNSVVIGNTNQDYTLAEWNDIYAAVKVNVNARTETSSSCFTLSNKDDTNMTATISAYDATCGGTDIIIPKVIDGYTITEYGTSAFDSKRLTNIVMQDGVITINSGAFYGNQLTSVEIPNSVQTIESAAFQTNQLTSVEIPNSVTTIGVAAFQNNQLTSVEIPNSVTTIGGAAFQNNQLTSVEIPNSVQTIDGQAFYNNQLTDVTINGNNLTLNPYSTFKSNPIETLTIGTNGTVNIGNGSYNAGVFSNISTLKTVIIGDGVQTIGHYAFYDCDIETLEIGNNVQIIGNSAFGENQLTSVVIPNSVTTIGQGAFVINQISSLTLGNNVQTIGFNAFYRNFISSVEIPNSVTTIDSGAFLANRLTSVVLGNHVQTIGSYAFDGRIDPLNGTNYGPNQITSVTIPASVSSMPCNAFGNQGNGTITTQITYENPNFTCSN